MRLVLHNGNVLRTEGGEPVRLVTRKTLLLLAILAGHAGEALSRRAVAQTVWPDVSEPAALDSLRTALSSIRKVLPRDAVQAEAGRIGLRPGAVTIETNFLTGEFMPDFDEDWVIDKRLQDRNDAVSHWLDGARGSMEQDDLDAALTAVETACARDPFSDLAAGLKVEILEKLGKRAQAAEVSQVHRRRVLRDLGTVSEVEPPRRSASSPLWIAAEWLLEREPSEALAFLRSTGGHWEVAPAANSLELHERALRQVKSDDPNWKAVRAQTLYIRWCLNGIADSLSPLEEAHAEALAEQDPETTLKLATVLAYCYLSTGQFARAMKIALELGKIAKATGNPDNVATAELNLSIFHFHAGDPKLAKRMMRRIGAQAEDATSMLVAGHRYLMAAQTHLDDGDLTACDERLQRAKQAFAASAGERMLGFAGIQEAELLDASGDPLRAREELTKVLGLGAGIIGHSAMAMAGDLLAEIDCRLGEFDLSAESLAMSRALRESLGTVASPRERRRLAPVRKKLVEKLGHDYLRRVIGRPRLAT